MRTSRTTLGVLAAAIVVLVPGTAIAGYAAFEDGPFGVHEDGVEWLTKAEVTNGCTPTEYCPGEAVTRAQMATFMHRLSGHAAGVGPSVDAATLEGRRAADLEVVNGFATVTEEQRVTDAVVDLEATCPTGTRALGGGGTIDGMFSQYMGGPTADGAGWFVVWVSDDYRTREVDATVTVTCAPTAGVSAAATSVDDRGQAVDRLRAEAAQRR
jgi:hypothetical protein